VTVEAVLLPRDPAAKLFGGWVAENYAVIKATISNHCDDKQFILHNIYFDYTDWALSGVYKGLIPPPPCSSPMPAGSSATAQADDCAKYTRLSQGGQVATVGALDVQDQLTAASVFSPRNLIVNGLVLVGTVAGGYAFVGATGAAQGIGAYNSAFIPGLQKFWPDRRIDQEKNVLALGYRTDQSTAIAKDDHGSYYAFFPLSVFLMPNLKALFLSNPAAFINPAEVLLDIDGGSGKSSKSKKASAESLRNFLLDLAAATVPLASQAANPATDIAKAAADAEAAVAKAKTVADAATAAKQAADANAATAAKTAADAKAAADAKTVAAADASADLIAVAAGANAKAGAKAGAAKAIAAKAATAKTAEADAAAARTAADQAAAKATAAADAAASAKAAFEQANAAWAAAAKVEASAKAAATSESVGAQAVEAAKAIDQLKADADAKVGQPVDEGQRRTQSLKLMLELTAPCNLVTDPNGKLQSGDQCPWDPNDPAQLAKLKQVMAEKLLFAKASLNVVKIVARGVMTVNVESIPPTIDTVTFDGAADQASYWTVQAAASKPAAATTDANAPAATAPAAPGAQAAGAKGGGKKAAGASNANAPAPATPAATATDTAADSASPAPPDKSAATPKDLTGVIAGKYLTDGVPAITAITVPGDPNAVPDGYIVPKSPQAVSDKSTDTSMAFKLQLSKTLPSGSKLTFQVSHNTGDASKGTSSQTTSNKVTYDVAYPTEVPAPPAVPTIANVDFGKSETAATWAKAGTAIPGTVTGSNLTGGTVSVLSITVPGVTNPEVKTYIASDGDVKTSPTQAADGKTLAFTVTLTKAIPPRSALSFLVTTKDKDGKAQTSNTSSHTVPKAAAPPKKKPAPPAKNPVPPAKNPAPPAKNPAPAPTQPKPPAGGKK
jgi:hypothetical protein